MEVFKIIKNMPNYEVSSHGHIRNNKTKSVVVFNKTGDGYCTFKGQGVHRLVALAFIPNPLNKPIVDHMDRLRSNNFVGNLRWATLSENNVNRCSRDKTTGMKGINYCSVLGLYYVRISWVKNEFGLCHQEKFNNLDDATIYRVEQMLLKYKEFVCHDEIFDYCQAVMRKGVNSMLLY